MSIFLHIGPNALNTKDIFLEEFGTLGSYINSFLPFGYHFIIATFDILKETWATEESVQLPGALNFLSGVV